MTTEDALLQIFNEKTTGKNHREGQRVFNNDLVSSLNITSEESFICIDGNVISEKLFNEYSTRIELDWSKKSIFSTFCSCEEYEKNEHKKEKYCCKHLVATFYKALGELTIHPLLNKREELLDSEVAYDSNLLELLLDDEKEKEELKIEVYVNKDRWSDGITAEFKIGLKNMSSSMLCVLKDLNQFLTALHYKIPVQYSKNFTLDIKNQKLSTRDKRVVDFIESLKALEASKSNRKIGENLVAGKYIVIPSFLVRDFFEVVRKHRVYLNEGFFHRPIETEISQESPAVEFDLKFIKAQYVLKVPEGMPTILGSKNDVFLYGTSVHLPSHDFCYKLSPYLKVFNLSKVVTFPEAEEEKILRRLIPDLILLSPRVTLAKTIKDKIIMEGCSFHFYFDQKEKEISLKVKVKYGLYEFNIFEEFKEKIIYRDLKKETQVLTNLRVLGFEAEDTIFYFTKGEEYLFRFFKTEIQKLQQIGEVYYSENFKGVKSIGVKGIKSEIKAGKYNYFEMDFKIGDLPIEETRNILRAFRENLKYYKLKTGEFLDLEEIELNKFLKLLDVVASDDIQDNCLQIAKNKGLFIDGYLEENKINYVKGKSNLKEIRNKFNEIEKVKFTVPNLENGTLRGYQKTGYNWLKTLEYLGFGGILGDEMGLGKTLQTIAFILSNKGSKTLIIAPTSLLYNWISEFEKFASVIKVIAVSGTKEEREKIIENSGNYDVLITTYNLLKKDLESYQATEFKCCIIDEAQYIKNPNSQNAKAVKEIKAETRFALTGTPIENSLMELWSIFDFIMPGYLYDEKRFSVRYHKKLKESPEILAEINRLIKPFILRRRKKEVIKELPDKIEKNLIVTLEEEQKKVYGAYAKYAMELIEKKVKEDEFANSKIEILSYITKLRQLCLDPSVVMEEYSGESAKVEALVELLHESIEEGHKILVFSQFTSVLKNIEKRLMVEKISFSYLDGSVPSEKRMNLVKEFNEGENSVFLISLKAGGTGLNLTSADIVIHFDPWWNPAVEAQATDRAHRIGQENVVEVIKIIAKGTIEEKILLLQEEKKKLIAALMEEELSNGESLLALSEKEIRALFEEC